MDAFQIATLIASSLFGTGGVVSWINARRAKRSGTPADETEARKTAPALDWLTDYYKSELESLRGDMRAELAQVRAELDKVQASRLDDAEYIQDLENHIWSKKPPPPPARRKRKDT